MRKSLCPVWMALLFVFTGSAAEVAPPWQQRPQPWQRLDQPVLSAHTTQQAWCKVVVYSPHVIFHEGRFRMWYLGTSTASRSNDIALGYAESADGLKWKEHPRNPILTGKDMPWGRIWQTPFVLFDREERVFKMWFVSGEGVRKDAQGKVIRNDQPGRAGMEGASPAAVPLGPVAFRHQGGPAAVPDVDGLTARPQGAVG